MADPLSCSLTRSTRTWTLTWSSGISCSAVRRSCGLSKRAQRTSTRSRGAFALSLLCQRDLTLKIAYVTQDSSGCCCGSLLDRRSCRAGRAQYRGGSGPIARLAVHMLVRGAPRLTRTLTCIDSWPQVPGRVPGGQGDRAPASLVRLAARFLRLGMSRLSSFLYLDAATARAAKNREHERILQVPRLTRQGGGLRPARPS